MIISHKYKFIFIKTHKTAGTAIEVYLSQFCDKNDILTPIYPKVKNHIPRNYKGKWIIESTTGVKRIIPLKLSNHLSAKSIKNRIPAKYWNEYYKFSVERNPWDKVVSKFFMDRAINNVKLPFNDYVKKQKNFPINYPLYMDNDNLIIDKVIKYENLLNELNGIFNLLKIPFNMSLNNNAKGNYRPKNLNYKIMYNNEIKNIIYNEFIKEIEFHNYAF
jgi:hypothetical protein